MMATPTNNPRVRRRRRIVGNPFSGRQRGLAKPGVIAVAALVVLFASAALYVFFFPVVIINPPIMQRLRRGDMGKLTVVGRSAEWMEQKAEVAWLVEQDMAQEERDVVDIDPYAVKHSAKAIDEKILVLAFADDLEPLQIRMRPDLSPESLDYVTQLIATSCDKCNFYRANKPGILQGVMASSDVTLVTQRGKCPPGLENIHNDCPAWDAACACHGPLMSRGMVAWAAGKTGPDFFVNFYKEPVEIWGTQHTVFGELLAESWQVMEKIWTLPTHQQDSMMTMLDTPLSFTPSWK